MSEFFNVAFGELVQNAANMTLPDPDLTLFWKNADDRVLWLDGDCDENWTVYAQMIIRWNIEDVGTDPKARIPIILMINTDGGDLYEANMLIDVIRASKTPVIGINMSKAFSAGCYIFLACHKRYAMPSSWFLFHRGSGNVGGNQYDVVAQTQQWNEAVENLRALAVERTKFTEEELEAKWKNDFFLSAREAVEAGVADAVVTSVEDAMEIE